MKARRALFAASGYALRSKQRTSSQTIIQGVQHPKLLYLSTASNIDCWHSSLVRFQSARMVNIQSARTDLFRSKCYFVCLNDYIDKILIPRHKNYREKATRTIHIPVLSEIGSEALGQVALRWYAKRPKLFAAFQRFVFQQHELQYSWQTPNGALMAKHFAERIASYDFWGDTEMWLLISHLGAAVRSYLETGSPGLIRIDEDVITREVAKGDKQIAQEFIQQLRSGEVPELWRRLALLPVNYEDFCREWFLPTGLGFKCSYE